MDAKQLELLNKSIEGGPESMADIPKLLRAYFYGDPGVGKTDLTARILEAINASPMWVYTDSGISTLFKFPELVKRTKPIPFDSFGQIRMLVQARDEGYEPYCNYDTLVLDTASTAINQMLREVVTANPLGPPEQKHPLVEAWPHYRIVESALKDTIEVLNKSGMHIIYLAHIRDPTEKDKTNKRFAIRPAGPEACYKQIAQEANLIGWQFKEKAEGRLIQFEPTLQETAKTQIPTIDEKTYKVNQIPELIQKYVNS